MLACGARAVITCAVGARIIAVCAFANRMVTRRAGAVITGAIDAQVRAVAAGAYVALIVVPFVLAVRVPVMQVVYVI